MTASSAQPLFLPVARAAADGRPQLATLIGADFSALSITPSRADQAPGTVRTVLDKLATYDAEHRVELAEWVVHDLGDAGAIRMDWAHAFDAIVAHAERAWALGAFVVGLGGDHSVSWPLVTAAAAAAAAAGGGGGRIGIVQLDVHHDVRPLTDGPSNGTPVRGLIERGVVRGSDVVQIGIHPFGNRRELSEFCDEQHIRRFTLDDVVDHGARVVAAQTREHLNACDVLYLTVDIDVLDRAAAPGTVAALPGGMTTRDLFRLVGFICDDVRTAAMDVVEFDPTRDSSNVTASSVAMCVMTALSAVARRGRSGM